jgi:hypothetical protein
MKIPLQEWLHDNKPKAEMYWKGSANDQFYFMKHTVIGAFPLKDKQDFQSFTKDLSVVSTHTSKSITLPVYEILWNGFRFVMRGNFYDWKVSIESPIPIFINFSKFGLFDPEQEIHPVYCEGFQENWVYGPYAGNPKRFTIELRSEHEVYCFLKILTHTF